jgi:RsiW-degrading membrane proteinase PrsW (M82 family)
MIAIALTAGLLPGFAWLVFYLSEDPHPEPKRLIAFTFLVGIAFGFFTIAIEEAFNIGAGHIGISDFSILSLLGLAAIEEIMKFTAAHFAVSKSTEFDDPIRVMIYMIVAALGFATLENIGAVANIANQANYFPLIMETISLRFIGATLLHTLTSGIIGYYWALGIRRGKIAHYLLPAIVAATFVHAFFNYLVLTYGSTAYSVLFLVLVGFFVLNDFEKLKVAPI